MPVLHDDNRYGPAGEVLAGLFPVEIEDRGQASVPGLKE